MHAILIYEQSGAMNVGGTVLKDQGDLDSDASKEQRLGVAGGSALGAASSMVDNKYASAAMKTGGEKDVLACNSFFFDRPYSSGVK